MPKLNPKSLEQKALEAISSREKTKDLVIAHTETEDLKSAKKTLYKFDAQKKGASNSPRFTIVLDESGEVADVKKLSEAEGRQLFTTPVKRIDPAEIPRPKPLPLITVNPTINDLVLNQGDTFSETITVTVPPKSGVSKADVYFLADRTYSMEPILDAVKRAPMTS